MPEQEPIFVSVREAAAMLALSTWSMYQKLNDQQIESRYDGRKRLVVVESLRKYAAALPDVAPAKEESA